MINNEAMNDEAKQAWSALGAADLVSLAGAPVFALMALFTGLFGDDSSGILCSATHGANVLGGMAAMYLLMSAFHSSPWLKLIFR